MLKYIIQTRKNGQELQVRPMLGDSRQGSMPYLSISYLSIGTKRITRAVGPKLDDSGNCPCHISCIYIIYRLNNVAFYKRLKKLKSVSKFASLCNHYYKFQIVYVFI